MPVRDTLRCQKTNTICAPRGRPERKSAISEVRCHLKNEMPLPGKRPNMLAALRVSAALRFSARTSRNLAENPLELALILSR